MEEFKTHVNTVLDFLIDNHYPQHSQHLYKRVFETLEEYLKTNGLTYFPELGNELLNNGSSVHFGVTGPELHAAVIKKLNAVYFTGSVSNVLVSSRKPYSALHLRTSFSECLAKFTESIHPLFSETQTENIRRRCCLFLKYLQFISRENLSSITYEDISNYHFSELNRLKPGSRMMEEGAICHFFQFLFLEKQADYSFYIYMYALETGTFIDISSFCVSDQQSIRQHYQIHISSDKYHRMINALIYEFSKTGYVPAYHRGIEKVLRYFELFLDIYRLDYSPEIGDIWLNSQRTKEVFCGSSWTTARRSLFLLKVYVLTEKIDFTAILPRGITGLSELPEWILKPLMDYSELRTKEKLDDDTVKNDIYSILRFCRFLISKNISSFTDVSADTLVDFNLYDEHLSSEGKNSCNARIRRFLRYLYREKIIPNPNIGQVLGYSAVRSESIITVLNPEEIGETRNYIANATTPIQLQDSAVILLGTEMGIRGCDIVRLKISDISFKDKTIRFIQDKTDVEIQVAMPVSVGNAIFKYLKFGRPKGCDSDFLFVSLKAPHKPLTRNVCFGALKRILPQRMIPGSGFHVTRKTFSTSKLRNGVTPERISSAMGQRSVKSLTPYLSLDGERLSMCPLSLKGLGIPLEAYCQTAYDVQK